MVRTQGNLGPVAVDFLSQEGVALSDVDFTPQNTNVTWTSVGPQISAGATNIAAVYVPILDDSNIEGDETFYVELARARGYQLGILQSSKQGYALYRRLGFQDYCQIAIYLWSGEASSPAGRE